MQNVAWRSHPWALQSRTTPRKSPGNASDCEAPKPGPLGREEGPSSTAVYRCPPTRGILSDWVPAEHGLDSSLEELDLMHSRRTAAIAIGLLMLAGLVAAAGTGPILVTGADHLDSPLVKIDGRIVHMLD